MILVIGGREQGTEDYARETYSSAELVSFSFDDARNAAQSGDSPQDALLQKMADAADSGETVLLMEEVSCGLVPMDPEERKLREEYGRLGIRMAETAERVDRVFCGIGTRIK